MVEVGANHDQSIDQLRLRQTHIRGIFDDDGRLLVLMTHNTDISDGWEREGEDDEFFYLFSPEAYAVGLNVAIWTMTH